MTSVEELNSLKRDNNIEDILAEVRSGKKIYNNEIEIMQEEEQLRLQEMERMRLQDQNRMLSEINPNPNYINTMPLQQFKEPVPETSYFTELLYGVFNFIKVFFVFCVVILFFNSSTSLNILKTYFPFILKDENHSYLSTATRVFIPGSILTFLYYKL